MIARSSNKVIALHNAWTGGDYNTGVKMSLIWPQVSSYFGGVAPNGDTGTTPPPATYTVSGTVTTSTGAALAGVTVNAGSVSATTSSTGAYTLSGLANNTYTLTPSLSGYTFTPATRSVTVSGANVTGQNFTGTAASSGGNTLTKGVSVTSPSVSTGNSVYYTMVVPAGASNLTFNTTGGTGDADMYVKFGSAPTDTSHDCRPYKDGNIETCTIPAPQAGTYHVRLKAYQGFSGVSLVGNYASQTVVHNVTLPSVSTGNWSSTYTVTIPPGTTKLVVNTSGGTGDADLYVYRDTAPSSSVSSAVNTSTRCVPYKDGNTETCTFDNPTAGTTFYIRVRAYSSFSGVNMRATRTQ